MNCFLVHHKKAHLFTERNSAEQTPLTGHKEEGGAATTAPPLDNPNETWRCQSLAGNHERKVMQSSNLNRSRSLRASCFVALLAMSAMTWPSGAMAWTGQPLAYVTSSDGIIVIDTGDNKVVDTIPASPLPTAVAPDGKRLYAFGSASDLVANISVIDATDGTVVATVPLDVSLVGGVSLNQNSSAIAVTPDGKHVYVTTGLCPFPAFACHPEAVYFVLWEIDTATNKVVAASVGKGVADGIAFTPDGQHIYLTNFDPYYGNPQVLVLATGNAISLPGNVISLPGYLLLYAIAITPDGRHAYVPYFNNTPSENVAILDTATKTVAKTVLVGTPSLGSLPGSGVAVAPDGKYVYVIGSNSVVVIDTASNKIVKTVPVGTTPSGVAITPGGLHVYVANQGSNSVSVINTASNKVVATIPVSGPSAISIIPAPYGVGALAFNAYLAIDLDRRPNLDAFELQSTFISTASHEIHPDTEPVKLQVGPFITTIPAGSFRRQEDDTYIFEGFIDGVELNVKIEVTGGFRYAFFHAKATGANLGGTTNPVQVSLGIGQLAGLTLAEAHFTRDH
jgi:YVTN family beta-propeller protein